MIEETEFTRLMKKFRQGEYMTYEEQDALLLLAEEQKNYLLIAKLDEAIAKRPRQLTLDGWHQQIIDSQQQSA